MDLLKHIKYVRPIFVDAPIYEVFDSFRVNKDKTFFPVVDHDYVPLGIVREYDLKDFTYGMFGRELIRHKNLNDFITPVLTVSLEAGVEEILRLSASSMRPEGIIVVKGGTYAGVLLNTSLLDLYEEHRLLTKRQLLQVQKMEAIGTLAGGIAHDFNNILTPIMGYMELIKTFAGDEERVHRYIASVLEATLRAKELVGQILAFSRQRDQERHPLHITPIVKEVMKLVRASLPSTIDILVDINTDEDLVEADPTQIYQIMMNLCTNSAHAMAKTGGTFSVQLNSCDGTMRGWSVKPLRKGTYVCISASDTGHGISPSIMSRIFDPFFTTKGVGEGTGMGLAVVHGIVTGYGGAISVESEPGKGSTFHVCLPVLKDIPQVVPGAPQAADFPHGCGERVLFVDDEPAVVEMISEVLRVSDFCVSAFTSSEQALAAFRETPDLFDIVITDQTMPGLTGAEMAREILLVRPTLPIIVCTGYSEVLSADQARKMGLADYLQKPLSPRDLINSVNRALRVGSRLRGAVLLK